MYEPAYPHEAVEHLFDKLTPKSIAVMTEREDFTGGENYQTFLKKSVGGLSTRRVLADSQQPI